MKDLEEREHGEQTDSEPKQEKKKKKKEKKVKDKEKSKKRRHSSPDEGKVCMPRHR